MKTISIMKLQLIGLSCMAFWACSPVMAQSPQVEVYGQHYGGKVQYHYRLVNSGSYEISSVWIGHDSLNNKYELKSDPSGMVSPSIPAASVTSPPGWEAISIGQEETIESSIKWRVADDNAPRVLVGQTLSGMSITLDKTDSSYVTSHATLHLSDSPKRDDITVPLQRFDTTPPTLTITLNPNVLHPNEKLAPITVTISVKDDYDPAPEIKLESITPSELCERGDIRDATLGTDDRQFMLKAESKDKAGRTYTVIYSATDATGNKSIATATVTVPHDEGGHEDRWDDKDSKEDKADHKRDH